MIHQLPVPDLGLASNMPQRKEKRKEKKVKKRNEKERKRKEKMGNTAMVSMSAVFSNKRERSMRFMATKTSLGT